MERVAKPGGLVALVWPSNPDWLRDCVHPEDRPLVQRKVGEVLATGAIFELEHRVRQPNGMSGAGFRLTGPTNVNNVATLVLTNLGNTADLIADSAGYLQVVGPDRTKG